MTDPLAQEIIEFWIGAGPGEWYRRDDDFDAEIRARFGAAWQRAAAGAMDHWINAAPTALALMILLDQFPRNMFRADPRAFATDAKVLGLAKDALEMGHDLRIPEPERQFFYLPFMHSEDLADQTRAIELIETRMPQTGQGNVIHARAHAEIIRRFGRFPYRNADLGRDMTAEEQAFLDAGGYGSVLRSLQES
ncbi:DUF924 family protein [Roseobacter sp. HKCCA2468]|uniref:DUF924 family protein n=1 Tax=Roseobacter sp. HKCCA2468 TaxID=3120342 RepID=UPI0030EF6064